MVEGLRIAAAQNGDLQPRQKNSMAILYSVYGAGSDGYLTVVYVIMMVVFFFIFYFFGLSVDVVMRKGAWMVVRLGRPFAVVNLNNNMLSPRHTQTRVGELTRIRQQGEGMLPVVSPAYGAQYDSMYVPKSKAEKKKGGAPYEYEGERLPITGP